MMEKGIFSKTFSTPDVAENFAIINKLGYSATQFNFASAGLESLPEKIPEQCLTEILRASHHYNVRIVAISATFNMIHPDVEIIDKGLRCLDAICEAARKLECPLVTLCTGTFNKDDQWRFHPDNNTQLAWIKLRLTMEQALAIADKHCVCLGIEPELANVINSAEKARQLIDELSDPRLKVIFDPANLFEVAAIDEQHRLIKEAVALLSGDIAIAHAKDRNPDGTFTTAGRGVLDYPWYLAQLRNAGFDGALITHGLSAKEAGEVSEFLDTFI